MDYSYFINYSLKLDKNIYKLPEINKKIILDIKKKLNISNIQLKQLDFNEKPSIKKNEDDVINELYKLLNKISEKKYEKLSSSIINIIIDEENINKNIKKKICTKFFDIITNNKVFSHLYAKLYNEIVIKKIEFKEIFKEELFKYLDSFNDIKYISPNIDYDKYCLYIQQIDKISNFTSFLVTCFPYNICSIDEIVIIIINFQDKIKDFFNNEEKIYENDSYVSNIYILLKSTDIQEFIIFHEDWTKIKSNHKYLHEFKGSGKNNKIKFKLMDINDIIDKIEK